MIEEKEREKKKMEWMEGNSKCVYTYARKDETKERKEIK